MKNRRFFLTLRNLELQDYNKIHMLLSMTGFGKAVAETKNKKITVEIKSLNSKQLDLNARVPSIYRDKELDLRNIVGRPLERGKIDMSVTVESLGTETGTTLNVSALEAYWELNLNRWDISAGQLIAKEAGVVIESIRTDRNHSILASAPALYYSIHDALFSK